jgi:transcriptional regulator
MSNEVNRRTEVLQGTLDLMVLQTLNTLGPQHGYAIASRLEQVSGGAIRLNMGSLYPGLIRLEQRGYLKAEWGVSDSNRKARFYRITRAGKRQLAAGKEGWDRTVAIMAGLFGEAS